MPEDDGTTGDGTTGDGTTGATSPLDRVADGLAADQVALLGARRRLGGPRARRLVDRGGTVGTVAGAALALGFTVLATVATVRTVRAGVGRTDVRTPYRDVTGFGRERSEADLALVDHRLSALVAALELGPAPTPADARDLVGGAARRLVRWVAAGRPHDDALAPTLRAYDAVMDVMEAPAAAEEGDLEAAGAAYVGAWRATLGR